MHAKTTIHGALAAVTLIGLLSAGGPRPVQAQERLGASARQNPGRAAVFGFPNNGTISQIRSWVNHGPDELTEFTGPNDKQLVGDFRGLGHDQVLFLNYYGGTRRAVIADFFPDGKLPDRPPSPTEVERGNTEGAQTPVLHYVEKWRVSRADSSLLDGWDDAGDRALAGDFMNLGYDQVMLINHDVPPGSANANLGDVMILDYHGATPRVRYQETGTRSYIAENSPLERGDVVLAGDFRGLGHDQVMLLNETRESPGQGVLWILDFSQGKQTSLYLRLYADTWHDQADRRYVGDFMGLGHDQVLFLNMQNGDGRVLIDDFDCGSGAPIVRYQESMRESGLLNDWHDANDWAFVGDFAALGRDQMLFMNRGGQDGRVLVADFGAGKPAAVRFREYWGASTVLNAWDDDDDVLLAGRFTARATAGLLSFNNAVVGQRYEERKVSSPAELETTLRSRFRGRVIIPRDMHWNMSGRAHIPLHSGVQLIGERGDLGSRPLLYTTLKETTLFDVTGDDVRVEGLHLQGPAAGNRDKSQPYSYALFVLEDPLRERRRRVVIADNEFDEWTAAGVKVQGVYYARVPEEYHPSWPRIRREDAGLVRVERNYIHHNARDDEGYGVDVDGGAYATIEGNVFDYNRHAIAASGRAYSGYIARFNYVLQGGFEEGGWGGYYNQHFDVHGTALDGAGKNTGYGGSAGEYYEIAFNTFRGDQGYYITKTRPAFMLRGKPTVGAYFDHNVTVHDDFGAAISLKGVSIFDLASGQNPATLWNFHASGNQFDTDPSRELATGDFDGDGRTDVFVATGTAWFFSRAGIRPWEFLQASGLRTRDLGLADIDNDGITDVLWREGDGAIYSARSGYGYPARLTASPVPMKELRFGDFDGDGRTDMFYTLNHGWNIWYGRTRAWTWTQSSSLSLSELLFGEFDAVRGTDVAGVVNSAWSYSSGGTASWARLNDRLTSSFDNAVAADFDGNGKSDIAFSDGNKWRYSRDGRGPLLVLRDGDVTSLFYPSLKELLIGHFDGGTRTGVVSFDIMAGRGFGGTGPGLGDRLVIWPGVGSGSALSPHSQQNMR